MRYTGSCHCGKIAYEIDGEIDQLIECNCSHCSRKGYLLWFVPRDTVTIKSSESMATYLFNKHKIQHRFCSHCGCAPFGEGTDPKGNATMAVNVRCLENLDRSAIKVVPVDGRSF